MNLKHSLRRMKVCGILDNLNKEQKNIVFSKDNQVFVNAGPGTGKTHTIVAFVVNLVLNKGILPCKIRVLTFTKQTSKMMKKRLKKELGKDLAKYVKVNTFHSLAFGYMSKLGFLEGRKQANNEELVKIAKSVARNKKCDLTPQELLNEVLSIGRKTSYKAKRSDNYKWFVKFYEKLDDGKLWEFDFLLNKMIEKLRMLTSKSGKQCNNYEYLIVDEYQDCNENQIELLKLLIGKNDRFLFVGDPDQMIYHWRGARMGYSAKVKKHFECVKVKNLTVNYRSSQEIVKASNRLIANNVNRLPKVIRAYKSEEGFVGYKRYLNEERQLKGICDLLKDTKGNSAVLCYTNDLRRSVADFLEVEGFNVKIIGEEVKSEIGKDDICVMTCHASKGLEFDNVFFPYLIEYYCGNGEDNRRLFYVAMTRARYNLYLFSIDNYRDKGAYVRCKPSKFLKEIGL